MVSPRDALKVGEIDATVVSDGSLLPPPGAMLGEQRLDQAVWVAWACRRYVLLLELLDGR